MKENKIRCKWVNLKNSNYVSYHDKEWSIPCHDDKKLFELLILELFQAGLSWECILNKRDNFKIAFDNFDLEKIINYDENKINSLLSDKGIIRNRLKINATINNGKIFKIIQKEFGSFDKYIWQFTNNKVIFEPYNLKTSSLLSDKISNDLKKRGMKFVGTVIIYSYLQAIGIINAHGEECFLYKNTTECSDN